MNSRNILFGLLLIASTGRAALAAERPPNFVVIYADDLAYADVGCFGAKGYATPHVDRLAKEGRKFTNFCVAQAVCSASRTALLTGCYPNRLGILGALGPKSTHGIHDDEWTIAEVLKQRGYATAIYGKWHLGHHPQFLPTRHGFDDYFGLPYSNDMWPHHPEGLRPFPDLPLIEGDKIVDAEVTAEDQRQLTTWYAKRAVKFIEAHRDQPFFLYVPHAMPHVPLFVSDKFQGHSQRGLFGDVIEEIDWSVGEILKALDEHKLAENTLVIFTSDNGPWLSYGDHAGSAGPLREGKGTTFEGGVRVPCVMRWPAKMPADSECGEPCATIDVLPTLAKLAGAELPDRKLDGLDVSPLLTGEEGAKSPREAYYYYWNNELHAVRAGHWKLHFPHAYRTLAKGGGSGGKPAAYKEAKIELSLFDLNADLGETKNLVEEHPDVVARLQELAEAAREDLGDSLTGRQGKDVRPAGQLKNAP